MRPIQLAVEAPGIGFSVLEGTTQRQMIDDSLRQERLLAGLSSVFGTLALLLACIGVFGVISYTVTRRTGEFGIRLALGATRRQVSWLVLRETMVLVIIGIVVGTVAAFAAGGLIRALLYDLTPTDPLSIAASMLVVLVVAVVAGGIPAHERRGSIHSSRFGTNDSGESSDPDFDSRCRAAWLDGSRGCRSALGRFS